MTKDFVLNKIINSICGISSMTTSSAMESGLIRGMASIERDKLVV
jgi:hypothetical protein